MVSFVRKLGACLFFLICLVLYARANFYRDPGSAFFDRARAYEEGYSRHRKSEAQDLMKDYSETYRPLPKANSHASLCVALTSVKRAETQYLETTIASMLYGLTLEERSDLYLSVFVADTQPFRHPGWQSDWMVGAVDDVYWYNVTSEELSAIKHWEESEDYSKKGVFDYRYALEQCYATGAPYIGLFEDDIMLADGWMVRALQGLRSIPSEDASSWLFMRLFNQERSTGWAHRYIGGNREHWIVLGIAIGITIPVLILRAYSRSARMHLDLGTLILIILVLNPALVILFYQCGKASLLPPTPGVFAEGFGCCSQAMIFPRAQVPSLVEFLRKEKHGQVDLLLKKRAKQAKLTRYSLYPVQAQHIGIDSARQTEKGEAQAIWSMAFEDLKPEDLHQQHMKMVGEYYGSINGQGFT